ncbi:MAG TPA: hypothetical protein VF272_03040 [Candidatus Saccharimonadia bacterium]
MVLLIHIAIALASLLYTTYVWLAPSRPKFTVGYTLVGLTLLSGTYLTFISPAHMIQACTTGLIYIGIVSIGMVAAHGKLAHSKNH